MIKVKLNSKEYQIPSYKELTVNQLIKLKTQPKQDLINYLIAITGMKFADVFKCKVKRPYDLVIRIGEYVDYTKQKPANRIEVNNKSYYMPSSMEIETVGQRFMIEENAKILKDEEYMCFVLAVGILKNEMDSGKIFDLKDKLMNEPYLNVLPTGFFLLKNLWIGKIIETKSLPLLIRLIKTLQLRSKLVLTIWRNTLITMKYRLWESSLIRLTIKYFS